MSVINSAEYQRYEQGRIVIAADTIVELNGEIIGNQMEDITQWKYLQNFRGRYTRL